MDKSLKYQNVSRLFLLLPGILLTLLSLIVIYSWHTQNNFLIRFYTNFPPPSYTTALGLLHLGIGSLALFFREKIFCRFAAIIALTIASFCALRFINPLFFSSLVTFTQQFNDPDRPVFMTLYSVLGYFVAGFALLLSSLTYRYTTVVIIQGCSSAAVAIGSLGLFSYITGVEQIAFWSDYTRMSFVTSLGMIIFGISFFFSTHFSYKAHEHKLSLGPVLAATIACLGMTLGIWQTFNAVDYANIAKLEKNNISYITQGIDSEIDELLKTFQRLLNRWHVLKGYSIDLWQSDTPSLVKDYPGLVGLEWLDEKLEKKAAVGEKIIFPDPALLKKVSSAVEEHFYFQIDAESKAMLILSPIFLDNSFQGVLIGLIKLEQLLTEVIPPSFLEENYLFIFHHGNIIFQSTDPTILEKESAFTAFLQVHDIELQIKLLPREKLLEEHQPLIPTFIIAVGIAITILVGLATYLSQFARYKEKELSKALDEKSENLALKQAILDSSYYSIISTNTQGTITSFNKAAEKMLGYSAEEMVGKCTPEVFHDKQEMIKRAEELSALVNEQVPPGFDVFVTMAQRGIVDEREWLYIRKDKKTIPVQLVVTAVKDKRGIPFGFLGIAYDLSEKKEFARMKNELLNITTHELRSPLTSICGTLDLLEVRTDLPEEAHTLISVSHKNAHRLLRLSNDLLDLQKMENKSFTLNLKALPINAVLTRAKQENQLLASKKNVQIMIHIPVAEGSIIADEDRLLQILTNLISNAIKFSPDSSTIEIISSIEEDNLNISIKDHGSGISPEDQPHMFEKFYRGKAATGKTPGTGLGLTITKSLVERHGGTIGFSSTTNGTTFWFKIPLKGPSS